MLALVRSLLRLPAPPGATPAGRWDRLFVAAVAALAILEATALRPDMEGRWLALGGMLVWLPTLLVRRTDPLLSATVFLVMNAVTWLVLAMTDAPPVDDLNTGVVALLIPFSLARWATGARAAGGLLVFGSVVVYALLDQPLPVGDMIGAVAVCVAAASVGAALRTRSLLHSRQLDDVRQQERERLARDLHDTVAHHLTAIAISAQAGLAVAETSPAAARDALKRIDEEATRTLAETRKVVRLLRTDDDAPDRPLDDLAALATPGGGAPGGGPGVEVEVADGLEDLSPTVAAAVHRIAQEGVANARRHAQDATSVHVSLNTEHDDLVLTVTDDGRPVPRSGPPSGTGQGFGIVGMTERAALLGGRLEAGPLPTRGWRVRAVLPLEGPREVRA